MPRYFKILFLFLLFLTVGASCVTVGGSKGNTMSGPAGMFVSEDKGETWKAIAALPTVEGVKNISGVSVYRVLEDPQDPNAMYLATSDAGLFFTYNNGATWQKPLTGPFGDGFVYSVAVHPKVKCTIYATNGNQVFRSDDCSRTWNVMYSESRLDTKIVSLAFNYFPPYQIYLAETNGDVLSSMDSGNSWTVEKRFGTRIINLVSSPLQEGLMYAITKDKYLFRTDNGGKDWVSLNTNLATFPGSKEYRRFVMHPNKSGTIYWISTYGILRSDDKGETWKAYELITPPGSAAIYGFAVSPTTDNEIYYVATISGKSTFYKSLDGGVNWITKKLPSGQLPAVLRIHPKNDKMLFLGYAIPPKQ